MPALSIIIPTHKRADILRQCLASLEKQTVASELEVIVISDTQNDDTSKLFPWSAATLSVKFLEVAPCHQGVARNRGVDHATAPLLLFIGDDIFLAPDACELHVLAHTPIPSPSPIGGRELSDSFPSPRGGGAKGWGKMVLGFTTWDPAMGITETMRWLEESGWQFGYPMIAQYADQFLPAEIQHRFTYTSQISLATETAKAHPFREDVSLYGWEDIEWGLRLKNAGIRLFYEPAAKALHHHRMTLEGSLKRMETLGRSAVTISALVPELDVLPKGWKKIGYHIFSMLPTMRGMHSKAFLRGMMMVQGGET
jgi:glycosyltransferase involved in cell wall biosynthesis